MRKQVLALAGTTALFAAGCLGQGTISTVAGNSKCCNTADGGLAINTWLPSASGVTVDTLGNLYIWDGSSAKVHKVDGAGKITTFAGNGSFGYTGDGGPATAATLFANGTVTGLAADSAGNLYISDGENHVVRKVNTLGIISTVAGTGAPGFSGDGGPATSAQLEFPAGIAVDNAGNLYIADSSNNRVRRVTTAGMITTYAGNGNVSYSGDGVQATTTAVDRPEGLAVDSAGNLYVSETSQSRVRKVNSTGVISTVAGLTKKTNGFTGDGGPATAATLNGPVGLATDQLGNLYIADNINNRVRRVDAAGVISTYAGNGGGNASTPLGDGGPATSAYIGVAKDVAIDAGGNLYIAGSGGGVARVRKVAAATGGLAVSPTSLSFSFVTGGATPGSQTVSVTSAGAAMNFTAAASATSGGNWLAVSPASGTTPANLIVVVNPAGVSSGVYQGAITLTPSSAGATPLTFSVTLTVTGAGAPLFSSAGVVNALGYQTKLAPDTVFVIFGSGMGPANLVAGSAPNYPATLGGTSVTLTTSGGGPPISAKMVYSSAGQVAALLPSSIAPGAYAARVTYNGLTSAPQPVNVVARSFGIATANSAGTGTAQSTIGNVNGGLSLTRFTAGSTSFNGYTYTLTPAHPGDTLVLWGTGGGADAANDTGGTSGDQTQAGNFRVMVGGTQVTPLYAGASSGYPGLWQINFTLPTDVATGCFTPVQVSGGGELSNTVSIPIASVGQRACQDPQLSQTALAALDAGGTITLGGFSVARSTNTSTYIATPGADPTVTVANQETISGGIGLYTAAEYATLFSAIKIGPCTVNDRVASSGAKYPGGPQGFLDAGTRLPAAGPGLAGNAELTIISNNNGPVYDLALASNSLASGRYTITGTGGQGVGPFTAAVNFPASFAVTNFDALKMIDRSQPLTISWTGSGLEQVYIVGSTYSVIGKDVANNNVIHTVSFTCQVPAAPGNYAVPSAVLSYLLPESIDAVSKGSGTLAVEAVNVQPFNAPLVAGGQVTYAGMTAVLAYSKNLNVQ
jgi:uncharacterized protein (TIGR03437 family)